MLVDSHRLYFEMNIAHYDLATKALLKAALIHIVIFVGAAIIYHTKYRDEEEKIPKANA